jgi:glycosidase
MSYLALLQKVYSRQDAELLNDRITQLVKDTGKKVERLSEGALTHEDVLLITYGDSFFAEGMKPLEALEKFIDSYGEKFSHIHILPFYPYSSDDGFSVIDYKKVNHRLGNWANVQSLSSKKHLMFDAVINHISAKSEWVRQHLDGDPSSPKYILEGEENLDWSKVTRPRTSPLFHDFVQADGSSISLWTTFSQDQVDLDYRNPDLLMAILDVLCFYIQQGARFLRLDAIGFMWKESGTHCIHLPQTHHLIQLFRKVLTDVSSSVQIVTETNVPHNENISYFGNGQNEAHMVYNFTLPPLLAYSILAHDVTHFFNWSDSLELPGTDVCFFNFLASHDGVGVRPVQGILSSDELEVLTGAAEANGGRVSYKSNADGGKDPYEINCNYFSLLHGNLKNEKTAIRRMILAHAVLLAFPGFPAIYFHSFLGSVNDINGMEKHGYARAINRARISLKELDAEMADSDNSRHIIADQIKRLIDVRKGFEAFNPFSEFDFAQMGKNILRIDRRFENQRISCFFNFANETKDIEIKEKYKVIFSQGKASGTQLSMPGYGFLWLMELD